MAGTHNHETPNETRFRIISFYQIGGHYKPLRYMYGRGSVHVRHMYPPQNLICEAYLLAIRSQFFQNLLLIKHVIRIKQWALYPTYTVHPPEHVRYIDRTFALHRTLYVKRTYWQFSVPSEFIETCHQDQAVSTVPCLHLPCTDSTVRVHVPCMHLW